MIAEYDCCLTYNEVGWDESQPVISKQIYQVRSRWKQQQKKKYLCMLFFVRSLQVKFKCISMYMCTDQGNCWVRGSNNKAGGCTFKGLHIYPLSLWFAPSRDRKCKPSRRTTAFVCFLDFSLPLTYVSVVWYAKALQQRLWVAVGGIQTRLQCNLLTVENECTCHGHKKCTTVA